MRQNLGISGDKKERQTINRILDYREHTGGTRGEVGGEGGTGAGDGGTCSDGHWVLDESVKSLCCTQETNIMLYAN